LFAIAYLADPRVEERERALRVLCAVLREPLHRRAEVRKLL
jgi:hypothetical protein